MKPGMCVGSLYQVALSGMEPLSLKVAQPPAGTMSRRQRHARDDTQARAVQNMHSIATTAGILKILGRSAAKWVQRLDAKCNRSALSKATRQPSFMFVRLWQHLLEPSVRGLGPFFVSVGYVSGGLAGRPAQHNQQSARALIQLLSSHFSHTNPLSAPKAKQTGELRLTVLIPSSQHHCTQPSTPRI